MTFPWSLSLKSPFLQEERTVHISFLWRYQIFPYLQDVRLDRIFKYKFSVKGKWENPWALELHMYFWHAAAPCWVIHNSLLHMLDPYKINKTMYNIILQRNWGPKCPQSDTHGGRVRTRLLKSHFLLCHIVSLLLKSTNYLLCANLGLVLSESPNMAKSKPRSRHW